MMKLVSFGTAIVAAAFIAVAPAALSAEVTEYTTEAAFDDVRQDLFDAVVNRGYTIDYESYIGDMLDRTGADVGSAEKIYEKAEFIQFCSAILSRKAMEADPGNIAYCPYVLFVYEPAANTGTIHVGFRRLDETGSDASKAALADVNGVLDEIVREAAGQ